MTATSEPQAAQSGFSSLSDAEKGLFASVYLNTKSNGTTDWDAVQKDMKSVSVDSVKRRLQYAKKAFSAANVKGTVGCTPAQSGGPSGGIEKKSPGKVNRESQKLDRNIPRKTGSAIPLLSKKSRRKMAAAEVKLEDVDEFSDDWS